MENANTDSVIKILDNKYSFRNGIYFSKNQGYYSNLNETENKFLISQLETNSTENAVKKYFPHYFDIIYSPQRTAGLEILDLKGEEICVDYGCMWGAITIPMAKRCYSVLGIDQTPESLMFLNKRIYEEGINNISLLCEDLNKIDSFENTFDLSIVNGVLEWIPEEGKIELGNYFGKKKHKEYDQRQSPFNLQKIFLNKVYRNLKQKGKLFLAIENRYDFRMFLGYKDPHVNLFFSTVLPRSISNILSRIKLKRPYVNWLYSFNEIKNMLLQTGFLNVDLYLCFPDYRFPQYIQKYDDKDLFKFFNSTTIVDKTNFKLAVRSLITDKMEVLLFKYFKLKYFSPSIIAVAQK